MGWTNPCQYVTGWADGSKRCGSKTQNLMEDYDGSSIAICAYHAQFSLAPREWPED